MLRHGLAGLATLANGRKNDEFPKYESATLRSFGQTNLPATLCLAF